MNQSILFPDIQQWDEATSCIRFPAQQAGALIECKISFATLIQLNNASLNNSAKEDMAKRALVLFAQARFDIEELAEELIEDEEFDLNGEIQISLS